MEVIPLTLTDINELSRAVTAPYANFSLAQVNDHVVKVSVMTYTYDWHYHPNSDETFIGMEGVLVIDLETQTIELSAGQLLTIPKNTVHRTRPRGERSVNLTVEHSQIETVMLNKEA
ncbi:cupin domain-containing protein [Spirosoma validum]|uniref:Cupin domain-containing protein n=1 Tax=Spirosoma validum TaxID=2771355 RepID=A0A927B7W8_9BACT|nr:cupin domain-containing protein [Spirosoma validum]MBD2757095.1 cupin domain-containing protein [Spirosoma validum]